MQRRDHPVGGQAFTRFDENHVVNDQFFDRNDVLVQPFTVIAVFVELNRRCGNERHE